MTYKIVVFSSNPQNTAQLRLNLEFSEIENVWESSTNRHHYTVLRVPQARVDQLAREILETKARIVHFCGHGLGNQGLVLETRLGEQQLVSTDALAGLFQQLAHQVECVILNACYSAAQAAVIHQHINYVIGTNSAIADDAAIAFSQGFYTGLFGEKTISEETIRRSYALGKNNIELKRYSPQESERQLSGYPEGTEPPRAELFTFLVKDPLNQIESTESAAASPKNTPSNLTKTSAANFVGREEKLKEVHQKLQQNKQVSISAIAGMGGIGKTELALQYAHGYQNYYPGSLCWFPVRSESLVTQIIDFARTYLDVSVPDKLETDVAKVNYCWDNWNVEPSLIVLDDVLDYGKFYRDQIKPYLPPGTSQIKVLITSREKPVNIPCIDLDVLSEDAAMELLTSFIGDARVEAELEIAKDLCKWLGYLPLGLELVGSYLAIDETLKIKKTLQRLEKRKLASRVLLDPEQADMNAQVGVATAFDLSWDILSPQAQKLGCYLSMFESEPFKWSWVEGAWITSAEAEEREEQIEDLERLRNLQLTKRNLLSAVRDRHDPTEYNYQLHSLIAQYFRAKLEEREQAREIKQKFCSVMIQTAQTIPQTPTIEEIQAVGIAIPHLSNVAQELTEYIDDDDLHWAFTGLGKFYSGQGIYNQAEQWLEQCLYACQERLGEQHPDVATSLNNLAFLYDSQGKYADAEPLYLQALSLRKQLLGEQHPDVATSLNNLAFLYDSQGRYADAEPLYLQALELLKQLLGEQHPDVATSLNNLAALYRAQGKYADAEPLYLQALKLSQQLLGEQHPNVATSLNNLAGLYESQGRYEDAEPLYLQALELRKQLLGEQHPDVASSLNNLAGLYQAQGRYEAAEPLYLQALKIAKEALGESHPHVKTIEANLQNCLDNQ